jgi:hypothetical protein
MHSTGSTPPAHDIRTERNADQVRLAQHLIDTTRDRLAGRDERGQRLIDVRPRERIVLGVLAPQPPPAVLATPTVTDVPEEPGVPIDHMPASEMGLTALIKPQNDRITLKVKAHFAVYLQHAPTHAEQAAHSGIEDAEPLPPIDEGVDDDEDLNRGVDHQPGNAPADPVVPPRPDPVDLAGLGDDAAAAVLLAVDGARRGGVQRRAEPSDFLRSVYQRYDVTVEHDLLVEVPRDSRPHTIGEQAAYVEAIASTIQLHVPGRAQLYAGNLLVPLRGPSAVRVPRSVVQEGFEAYESYLRDHARADWTIPTPTVAFRATVQRTPDHRVRLALTLVNATATPDRDRGYLPELAVYDAGFWAAVQGADIVPTEYRLVERDYRTQPRVFAHGRFCCLDEDAFAATGALTTTTMPIHRQMVYESKPELQPTFDELASDPLSPLEQIQARMNDYLDSWDTFLGSAALDEDTRAACESDRAAFADEMHRFTRGVELLRDDLTGSRDGLGIAFQRANEAFALMNTDGGLDNPQGITASSWRLFQIVYVVANLGALAAREAPPGERAAWRHSQQNNGRGNRHQDLDELAVADVLWFPTGGGKSAALYGIVAVALFFDRLRGKHAGVSAVIRFPLRMLSVQQLERVLRLVAACETIRTRHGDVGDPIRLGYWVGRGNTPNRLTDPSDQRWHDIGWMAEQGDNWKRTNVVIPTCPYCGESQVALDPDPDAVVLAHRCRACNRVLPVDVTDDEVYRHLPAVLVATVDKVASLAFNAHASHLTHGPVFRCPEHGYVTHPQGPSRRCLARERCTRTSAEWQTVSIKDPAPALVIQDELHLLSEELGTFAAHYETLWQYLCTSGSGLPSKVLAATATISDYQNQVSQLYALTPRRFPTDGWIDGDSFYANRHDDLLQRIFVGALPTQMDVVEFGIAAGEALRAELHRLNTMAEVDAISELGLTHTEPSQLPELLFGYELQAFYCNRKTHADRIHARAERVGHSREPMFQSERLNGQTPLSEISDVIRRVERETLDTPAANRLACIAGTSLISHGIDLARLNVLFILGMPSTIAYYVQATSRAGRSDVGIVFTSLARHFVRDRSVFHFFDAQHRYVNVLVEPVALNRFSAHGPRKTASGVLAALLTQGWARDPDILAAAAMPTPTDLSRADAVRQLFSRLRASAETGTMPNPVALLQEHTRRAYGLGAHVLDQSMSRRFAETVDQQIARLITGIDAAHEMLLTRSLRPRPPTSLRDVDASADFGASNYPARQRFRFLGGTRYDDDENDFATAAEED